MNRVRGAAIKDIQLGVVMQEMLDIAFTHGVPIPASLALTVKALSQMQSAAAQLDPAVDPFEVAGRFITRSTMRHVLGKADPKILFYEVQEVEIQGRSPARSARAAGRRPPGEKLEVNFKGAALEDTIWSAGRQLALGVLGGFALLASAVTSNARGGTDGWAIAFGVAGFAWMALPWSRNSPAADAHAVEPRSRRARVATLINRQFPSVELPTAR